jgi:hypothetical protein
VDGGKGVRKHLGDQFDSKHFTPPYNPWDQRLCIAPDADIFRSMREGRVSVVTDHVETFKQNGVLLKSGRTLDADIIITATGLQMKLISGMQLNVDGEPVNFPKTLVYKGMMFSDVPNLAFAIGYTNASWTLKCDLTSEYVCRLLNYMDQHEFAVCTPRVNEPKHQTGTGNRLQLRIRAARTAQPSKSGIEAALAPASELHERSFNDALWTRRRRHHGVQGIALTRLQIFMALPQKSKDATGLSVVVHVLPLPAQSNETAGCHGLAPWRSRFHTSNKREAPRDKRVASRTFYCLVLAPNVSHHGTSPWHLRLLGQGNFHEKVAKMVPILRQPERLHPSSLILVV